MADDISIERAVVRETDVREVRGARSRRLTPRSPTPRQVRAEAGSGPQVEGALSPTDELYSAFVSLYGNSNPRQIFSLVWPGTVLDPGSYSYPDPTSPTPVLTSIAQSKLFDQHYPIASITQPDGTRVSDRYRQALDRLGPIPNGMLLKLQALIRDRLNQTTQVIVNGQVETMTILDQFNYLSGLWTAARQAWEQMQANELALLQASGDPNWFSDWVSWYALAAPAQLDAINAAQDRLLAEFPLTEFQDAIGILSTQEGAALLRARAELSQATLQLPPELGGDYVISAATPNNWGQSLPPTTTFIDLLAGPDAQQASLNNTIRFLQQQIYAWNAVIAQIPGGSQADIQKALDAFNAASTAYNGTITSLLTTYSNNAVLAVQIYAMSEEGDSDLAGINEVYQELEQANQSTPPGPKSLTDTDVGQIAAQVGDAQASLISSNASMVASGVDLARKATDLLNTQAGAPLRAMLAPVINQLTSQLSDVQAQSAALQASCVRTAMLLGKGAPTIPANAYEPNQAPTPTPSMPNSAAAPDNQNWQTVTIEFDANSLAQSSNTSTYFDQWNWSVDLFFGSAGGQSTKQGSSFATKYLQNGGKVRIGMLATKVLIERDWMHPEIFQLSSNYFRLSDHRLTTPDPVAAGFADWSRDILLASQLSLDTGSTTTQIEATAATLEINKGPFPGYPVALLIAKDVTVHIEFDAAETNALSQQSQQNSTEGGGFLCFSVSNTQSSSSSSNSSGSYTTGGTYVFRIAAPQVIGAWLQIAPDDSSQELTSELANEIAQAFGFATRLQAAASAPRAVFRSPKPPTA